MARRRHLSRIAVMQTLFERELRPEVDPFDSLKENMGELRELDVPFAEKLLLGVLASEKDLINTVRQHAPDWPIDRMDPISRDLLLVGAFELLHGHDAPAAVVMNEAIEIAKEFGTQESGKFVNGVLNAIANREQGKLRS